MKRKKLYLDTSVVSHLDQQDVPERMKETQRFWEILKTGKYDVVISEVVFSEINGCSTEKRRVLYEYVDEISYIEYTPTKETDNLVEQILEEKILTNKQLDDCFHIASAILTESDVLVSWNFKHLVKAKTIEVARKVKFVNMYNGNIDIYTPNMLLEEEI